MTWYGLHWRYYWLLIKDLLHGCYVLYKGKLHQSSITVSEGKYFKKCMCCTFEYEWQIIRLAARKVCYLWNYCIYMLSTWKQFLSELYTARYKLSRPRSIPWNYFIWVFSLMYNLRFLQRFLPKIQVFWDVTLGLWVN